MEILSQLSLIEAGHLLGLKKSQVANIRAGQRELSALESALLDEFQCPRELLFFNWLRDDLRFWANVEQLQSVLRYNDAQMSEHFSTTLKCFRFSRSRAKSLPQSSVNYFFLRYQFHPIMWFSPDADIDCLALNITSPFKSNAYLPKRFEDRKSTRLNSSHVKISYAVFCLKKKT